MQNDLFFTLFTKLDLFINYEDINKYERKLKYNDYTTNHISINEYDCSNPKIYIYQQNENTSLYYKENNKYIDANKITQAPKLFNKELFIDLSDYITELYIGFSFDNELDFLPPNIKKLTFGSNFNNEIKQNVIPNTVQYLSFSCINYNYSLLNVFPNSIIELYLYSNDLELEPNVIPNSVKILHISSKIKENVIPNSVEFLYYNSDCELDPYILPNSIIKLSIDSNITILPNVIPNSVLYLYLLYDYNQKIIPNSIPNSVIKLKFGLKFNQQIDINELPNNLKILKFGHSFNQKININVIPNSVKYIEFNNAFNQDLTEGILPQNIETLILKTFNNNPIYFPNSIKVLSINHCSINHMINYGLNDLLPTLHELRIMHYRDDNTFLMRSNSRLNINSFNNLNINILCIDEAYDDMYRYKIHEKYLVNSNINNDIFINKLEHDYNFFHNHIRNYELFKINKEYINSFYKYINTHFTKEKLIGNVILEELVSKVLNPRRINKLSIDYNMDFMDIIDLYNN